MSAPLSEIPGEQGTLDWQKAIGWEVAHGPDIAPRLEVGDLRVQDAEGFWKERGL